MDYSNLHRFQILQFSRLPFKFVACIQLPFQILGETVEYATNYFTRNKRCPDAQHLLFVTFKS